eukprot:c1201_g1_i2.p1 GENE.c1201_g1_i2~~c1201_g1_i2.p1  ORF type:complete len:654 (-),score=120.33 c1201_g1_i2:369-2330(-)
MMKKRIAAFRTDELFPTYLPANATQGSTFNLDHPISGPVEVCVPAKHQPGDLVLVDSVGVVHNVWGNEARAWLWYSWARSPMYPFLLTYIAVYCLKLAETNTDSHGKLNYMGVHIKPSSTFTLTLVICYIAIALASPVLGAISDYSPHRKRMFVCFFLAGCFCVFMLIVAVAVESIVLSLLFGAGAVFSYEGSLIFMYAYLPEICRPSSIPKLSAYGLALTNIGQVVSLALFVPLMLSKGDVQSKGARDSDIKGGFEACLVIVGIWWVLCGLFSCLLLDPRPDHRPLPIGANILTIGFQELYAIGVKARQQPSLFTFLIAYMIFILAINALISGVSVILAEDFNWSTSAIAGIFVGAQLIGSFGAILSIRIGRWLGLRRLLILSLISFCVISAIASFLYEFRSLCGNGGFKSCDGACFGSFSNATYNQAVSQCGKGFLAVPSTHNIATCMATSCKRHESDYSGCYFDLTSNSSLDTWTFSNGHTPLFWSTQDSQPIPKVPGKDCVVISNSSGVWVDAVCDDRYGYVCQREKFYEGSLPLNGVVALTFLGAAFFNGFIVANARAYFASMVPTELEAEMFGLFALCNSIFVWVGLVLFAVSNERQMAERHETQGFNKDLSLDEPHAVQLAHVQFARDSRIHGPVTLTDPELIPIT